MSEEPDTKPQSGLSFSIKDGIKASGTPALIVAIIIALGTVFYINNKSVVGQLQDIIGRIDALVIRVENLIYTK